MLTVMIVMPNAGIQDNDSGDIGGGDRENGDTSSNFVNAD